MDTSKLNNLPIIPEKNLPLFPLLSEFEKMNNQLKLE